MDISAKGIQLLKHSEGLRLKAYKCQAGVPTIGYGSTFYEDGKPVKMGDTITAARAEALLPAIAKKFAQAVDMKTRKIDRVWKQTEFDALVNLTFNIGIGNFNSSTLLKKLQENAPVSEIVAQFKVWNKSRNPKTKLLEVSDGLVKRRASEAHLFEHGEVKIY